MDIEKRKFTRANISCKISTVFGERLLVFNCHTENISEEGAGVILEEKLNISTIVDIELFLDKEIPIRSKGRIVWASEMKPVGISPRLFNTGIEFISIDDYSKEEIKRLVNSLTAEERS